MYIHVYIHLFSHVYTLEGIVSSGGIVGLLRRKKKDLGTSIEDPGSGPPQSMWIGAVVVFEGAWDAGGVVITPNFLCWTRRKQLQLAWCSPC